MKILITGINGLVGKDVGYCLAFAPENEIFGIGRAAVCYAPGAKYTQMDMADLAALERYLRAVKPEAIIHCAAMTKIDKCETEREEAVRINVDTSRVLAEYGCRMIYMSSDAVFSGHGGAYRETDTSDAINFYGQTKYAGEQAVLAVNDRAAALRMSIFGYNINANKSIAQWAAESICQDKAIKGFTDVIINPVYTKQIVQVMQRLLTTAYDYHGVLNIGCREEISKYQMFGMIADRLQKDASLIEPASVDSMTFPAARTKNTTLNVARLQKELGMEFHIAEGMAGLYEDYLRWL